MAKSTQPKILRNMHMPGCFALFFGNRIWQYLLLAVLIFLGSGSINNSLAQVAEDSVRLERPAPEIPRTGTYNNFLHSPYQHPFSEQELARYSLYGVDGRFTFHQRLGTSTIEDFMFGEESRYDPYGPEWANGINMRLAAILSETFKEQNSFLQKLARIIPFLGLGFFEEYEVPIVPRQDNSIPQPLIPDN